VDLRVLLTTSSTRKTTSYSQRTRRSFSIASYVGEIGRVIGTSGLQFGRFTFGRYLYSAPHGPSAQTRLLANSVTRRVCMHRNCDRREDLKAMLPVPYKRIWRRERAVAEQEKNGHTYVLRPWSPTTPLLTATRPCRCPRCPWVVRGGRVHAQMRTRSSKCGRVPATTVLVQNKITVWYALQYRNQLRST
jgi:hypothetical protein